jgi:hypothetical protein
LPSETAHKTGGAPPARASSGGTHQSTSFAADVGAKGKTRGNRAIARGSHCCGTLALASAVLGLLACCRWLPTSLRQDPAASRAAIGRGGCVGGWLPQMGGNFVRFVDSFVVNLGELAKGGGQVDVPTLLFFAFVLLVVALPCSILAIVAMKIGPAGNDPIPYTPSPDAPKPPRRTWSPDKKEKKLVDARLAVLKDKRPATPAQREAAYKAAVYQHRGWSASGYTGSLRAHDVSPQRTLPASGKIVRPDYAADGSPHSEMKERMTFSRKIKKLDAKEIKAMRVAGRLGREVLDIAALAVRPGVTCDEIDTLVHEACVKRNCYPSPLNYMRFPKSVCTSVNEVICHGVPDGYELQRGDIINIDVTVYHNGFHADLNETYFVGGTCDRIEDRIG